LYTVHAGRTAGTYVVHLPKAGVREGNTYQHYVEYKLAPAVAGPEPETPLSSTKAIDESGWHTGVVCSKSAHENVVRVAGETPNETNTLAAGPASNSSSRSYSRESGIIVGATTGGALFALTVAAALVSKRRRRRRAADADADEQAQYENIYRAGEEDEFTATAADAAYRPKEHNRRSLDKVLQVTQGGQRRGLAGTKEEKAAMRRAADDDEVVV
jgi:hypothetical protein